MRRGSTSSDAAWRSIAPAARLQALSPRATLARGYAIVRAADAVVRDAASLSPGGAIEIELARGGLGARVEEVRP